MARPAPRPLARLSSIAPVPAAGLALAGAVLALGGAVVLTGRLAVSVPELGPAGGLALAVDPGRAGLIAAVLAGGAAGLLAAPGLGVSAVLMLAGLIAILANNLYTLVFAALIVGFLAARHRAAAPAALAVLPATLLAVAETLGQPGILLAAGAALFPAGYLLAALGGDLLRFAQGAALGLAGLALMAAGLGDAGAMRLALETGALAAPALALAASRIEDVTGSRAPDWLGGLARGMPGFALCFGGAAFWASLLPPGPGFVAFQGVFAAALRTGWPGALAAIALAGGFALAGFGSVGLFALVCLGRPRSLRAAAAEDLPRRDLVALGLPAAAAAALALVTAPFLLLIPLGVLLGLWRWSLRAGPIEAPAFEDGFARPPAWLPFGDPVTQINATGFAAPLRGAASWFVRRVRISRRGWRRP
ncbi:hypothetical protein [Acidiphilium multivorum]|uniref:hypothetical protein n=1 Tax=Acidiphilium multivorum TaxID=62140 RepID=UPI001B8AEE3E|nr:hypothetical protein [Acidiphilium multivorum]MBS3024355.1 hypothetical protein [Acidiphilium multivorum]